MSSTSAEAAVAGWYPDPYGRRRLRWWDGAAWSAYARDTADVEWDDEPLAPAEPEDRPPALPGLGVAIVGFVAGVIAAFAGPRLVSGEHDLLAQVVSSAGLWLGLIGACGVVSRRRGTGSTVQDFGFRFRWVDVGIGLGASLAGRFV